MDEAKQTHEPFFTVITPVYKAEAYLEDSIKSVLDQTFGDFELWLVDDGSPDNSGKICDAIASRDSRVHVHHQQNAGPSSARNYGLEHAKGQYVCFMDADDRVKPEWLEVYHQHADADILIQGCEMIWEDGTSKVISATDKFYNMEDGKYKVMEEVPYHLVNVTYSKSVRRALVAKNKIRFDETINWNEDNIFMINCLSVCHTVRSLSFVGYFYRNEYSYLTKVVVRDVEETLRIKKRVVNFLDAFFAEGKDTVIYRIYITYLLPLEIILSGLPTTPRSTRILAYQWIRKYIRYADFSQYGWRQQVFRLIWLPAWLFDVVLLGTTGSYAVAMKIVPKGVRRALKKVYHALRHKEGSAS